MAPDTGSRARTDTPTKGSGAPLKKPDDAGAAGAPSWELGPQAGPWLGAGTDTPAKGSGTPLKKPDDARATGALSWELGPQAGRWLGSSAGRGEGWGSRGRGRTDRQTDTQSPRSVEAGQGPSPP